MVLLKMLMEIALPKMGVVGDDDDDDFPLREGSSPVESLHRWAKVVLPKFRLETAALRPESHPLIFLGQNDLYTRRWAPEVGWVEHNHQGALVSCAHQVAPLR